MVCAAGGCGWRLDCTGIGAAGIGCGCCGGTGADGSGPELGGPVGFPGLECGCSWVWGGMDGSTNWVFGVVWWACGLVAVLFGTADVGIGWNVTAVFVFTAVA